ncbi:uncharacterized protein [Hemitrygon akajei]|uniref:uncharacterized protein n=1 Tax=Hemitrygon akajei TaxID=2704970 RepID=UPI003BF9ED14
MFGEEKGPVLHGETPGKMYFFLHDCNTQSICSVSAAGVMDSDQEMRRTAQPVDLWMFYPSFQAIKIPSEQVKLFDERNMMLVSVLVVTALFVSDITWTHNSLELERTQHHLEKRKLSRGPCDENWFNYSLLNSCYRFFSDRKTWEEAQDFCNQDQCCGQLASVYSAEHNTFISNVIKFVKQSRPKAWIGLNDICKLEQVASRDGQRFRGCFSSPQK